MHISPVLSTLAEFVAIDSVNPEWGGPGEAEAGRYVRSFFEQSAVEVFEDEVLPGRSNVIVKVPGRSSASPVVLEAHLDTVSANDMTIPPFEPTIEDGRLYGRGSCDTKGGLAAMMHAVRDLADSGERAPQDVYLAATIDEEHAFRGVTALVKWFEQRGVKPGAAIVAEPTELRLVRANKGVLRWRVETRGVAAHSSKPHLGRNAITAMAEVIGELEKWHDRLASGRTHELVGPATGSIGLIEGGDQINFVPSHCTIALDRRMLPGETAEGVLAEYDAVLDRSPEGEVIRHPPDLVDEAMETPADAGVVVTASAVLEGQGRDAASVGVPFGCDATKLSRAGVPSIIFGPGSIDQAHGAVEWVDANEVESAFAFYWDFLLNYRA